MTDIRLETQETKLSLAILLEDDYTGANPIGNVYVSLEGRKEKSIKNLSSYYLFLDLPLDSPETKPTIQIRSDYYFNKDLKTKIGQGVIIIENNPPEVIDPENPVKRVKLKPKPSYPFPVGATLIRGMIYDSSGKTVPSAKINVMGTNMDINNMTSEEGEFVLYFRHLKEAETEKVGGRVLVKVDNSTTITLQVEYKENNLDISKSIILEEGPSEENLEKGYGVEAYKTNVLRKSNGKYSLVVVD